MHKAATGIASAALVLAGCSLAPAYKKPAVAIPESYKEIPAGWTAASPEAAAPGAAWWLAFEDPVLSDLEDRVEKSNPSIAGAVFRYDRALAILREARADFFPQVSVGAAASRDRASSTQPLNSTGKPQTYTEYEVGGSFSWEIDLFGRVRNTVAAGHAEAQASEADVRGVRLATQAGVASAYFGLRGLDARERLLEETVDAYQRADDLTRERHDRGRSSALDSNRARTQLASAKAELSGIHAERAAVEHSIATFVGEPASTFSIRPDSLATVIPQIPTSAPSTLLQRRPDIDAAERRVAAANARIGIARAALFPTLSLTGDGGYLTTAQNLLTAPSAFWALGPATALSVFDAGARSARVRVAWAEFNEASANYRQTVLVAFQEVEDVLAASRDLVSQVRDQEEATQAAARTRDLALIRYRAGASDYLEVVTAQTAALDAEREWLFLRTQQLTTAVDSVRVLGGPDGA